MNLKLFTKKIAYWTMPPAFQDFIRIHRRRFQHMRKASIPGVDMEIEFMRNKKFYNIHKGERCFILGSGQSINKQDLKPLKNEICFAMSMFFLHKDIREINPLYHVDATNHAPYDFEMLCRSFDAFRKFYSERTVYFFGHNNYEFSVFNFLKQNIYPDIKNVYYLNYYKSIQLDESNYNDPDIWNICKPLFTARAVVYCAIQVAVYMGFKYIYLLGCDHDYLTYLNHGSCVHFYKDGEGIDDSVEWKEEMSTEKFFLAYYIRWKQYRLMRSYLESKGCYIYNATEGGLLDVFPNITLVEAIRGRHES